MWIYSASNVQHHEQPASATEEHVQLNKGKTNARNERQAEKPATNTNTESMEQSVTCTPRKSSRIAKREDTEQLASKTISPKKLVTHTKNRLYRVAQNKIHRRRICNISATSGLILKILEAA